MSSKHIIIALILFSVTVTTFIYTGNRQNTNLSNYHEDRYSVQLVRVNEKDYISRFRQDLLNSIDISQYPNRVLIVTALKTDNNGLPATEENERFFDIEDAIVQRFETDGDSIYI